MSRVVRGWTLNASKHNAVPVRTRAAGNISGNNASTSTAKQNIYGKKPMLCIWWDQHGVVCYELLKPNETNTGALYRTQLMRFSRVHEEKRAQYYSYSRDAKVILLHDNARSHVAAPVKTHLETLTSEVLSHPPYSPNIAPVDYYLFRSTVHGLSEQHFTSYEDTKNWVDSWITSKDEAFFRPNARKMGKSSG